MRRSSVPRVKRLAHPHLRPWLHLVLGVAAISLSTLWVKLAGVPGVSSGFWRCAFPALATLPLLPGALRRIPDRRTLGVCLGAGAIFGAHFALWNHGILLTDSTRGTLYPNIAVIWFTLAAMALHGERPGRRVFLGLGLAMVGLVTLAAPKLGGGGSVLGDALCFLCSFSYAAYLLLSNTARPRIAAKDFVITAVPVSAVTAGVIATLAGAQLTGFSPGSWAALAGLGLVTHLGGSLLIVDSLGKLPAGPAGAILLLQAPMAALVAWPLLGERPDAALVLGGAVMLTGVRLATSHA